MVAQNLSLNTHTYKRTPLVPDECDLLVSCVFAQVVNHRNVLARVDPGVVLVWGHVHSKEGCKQQPWSLLWNAFLPLISREGKLWSGLSPMEWMLGLPEVLARSLLLWSSSRCSHALTSVSSAHAFLFMDCASALSLSGQILVEIHDAA